MIFVQTLGTPLIRAGGRRYTPSSAHAFATLFYLSANGGRRIPREKLQSLIFPDRAKHNGAHSVRQLLYRLRGAGVDLDRDAESVCIPPEAITADYTEIIAADRPTAEQIANIEQGLLPGYEPAHSEEYAEWYEAHRAEISMKLQRRMLQELARSKRAGDWTSAERCARACLKFDSLNYEANCGLAEAVAAAGSKSLALELLDDFMKELGESAADLKRPAATLRKRICEKMPAVTYRSRLDLPFIGREQEMLQLSDAFQRARRGEAQCVVLSGEAGIGKTRIAAEFKTVAVLEGARVERVVAQPQDTHRPMGAFIDLVPLLLQLPGALGCSPESMAALRRLTKQIGSVDEAPSEATKNSEALFYSITCAISDLVDAIACETTLVVVVEDAHWLDTMSLGVLADLVSERKERRLMVVVTTRTAETFTKNVAHSDRTTSVRIGRLEPQSATSLVDAALRACDAAVDPELTQWMCSTSAGHPLFVSLLALHFDRTRARFSIPPTITALLEQRVGALSSEAGDVLRTCAILGRYCSNERLVRTLDVPTFHLLQLLRELDTAGLVTSHRRIELTHPLVAEVALRPANQCGIALLFARVAGLLEEEVAATGEVAQLWDCADLWVHAAQPSRALAVLRTCARHAVEIGRPEEAAATLLRALQLVGDPRERAALAGELIRNADLARNRELILHGFDILQRSKVDLVHDDVELAVLHAMAFTGREHSDIAGALTHCCGDEHCSEEHRMKARILLAKLIDDGFVALTPKTNECLIEAASIAESGSDGVHSLAFLLIYHTGFGDLDKAAVCANRILKQADALQASAAASHKANAGLSLWRAGEWTRAMDALESSYLDAERAGTPALRLITATYLAANYHDLLRDADRDAWWLRAEQIAEAYGVSHPDHDAARIEMALARSDLEEAQRLLATAETKHAALRGSEIHRWISACGLRLRQLSTHALLSNAVLERLAVLRRDGRRHCNSGDLEMEVLLADLLERGQRNAAQVTIERYIRTDRRSRSPLRRGLRELRLGADSFLSHAGLLGSLVPNV